MVIDTHIHPALFAPICEDQERFRRRCDAMNYHLMKPSDMALLRKQYALARHRTGGAAAGGLLCGVGYGGDLQR